MNIEESSLKGAILIDVDFTKHEMSKLRKLGYAKVPNTTKLYDKEGTYVEKFIMLDYQILMSDKKVEIQKIVEKGRITYYRCVLRSNSQLAEEIEFKHFLNNID